MWKSLKKKKEAEMRRGQERGKGQRMEKAEARRRLKNWRTKNRM